MDSAQEIKEDLERAEKALQSAERNFQEGDILTAANRLFVACESAIYALLKLEYGTVSMSRERILTRLKEVDVRLKEIYDQSYGLRVQADYGKQSRIMPLTTENMKLSLAEVKTTVEKANKAVREKTRK